MNWGVIEVQTESELSPDVDVLLADSRIDAATASVEFGSVRIEARSAGKPLRFGVAVKPGEAALLVSSSMLPSAASRAIGWRDCSAFLVGAKSEPIEVPPTKYLLSILFPAAILQEVESHLGQVFTVDVGSALFWPFLAFAWTAVVEGGQQTGLTMYYTERLLAEMITGAIASCSCRLAPSGPHLRLLEHRPRGGGLWTVERLESCQGVRRGGLSEADVSEGWAGLRNAARISYRTRPLSSKVFHDACFLGTMNGPRPAKRPARTVQGRDHGRR